MRFMCCFIDMQAGRSSESLLEELAQAGLAHSAPQARVTDYRGGPLRDQQAAAPAQPDLAGDPVAPTGPSAADGGPQLDAAVYPPPSAAGVRQALTALCVLPLMSAALHNRCTTGDRAPPAQRDIQNQPLKN